MVALREGSTLIKVGPAPDLIDRSEEGSVKPIAAAVVTRRRKRIRTYHRRHPSQPSTSLPPSAAAALVWT